MILQMKTATLQSNKQQRTQKDGDTEEGRQKPAEQQMTTEWLCNAILYYQSASYSLLDKIFHLLLEWLQQPPVNTIHSLIHSFTGKLHTVQLA